MFSLLPAELHSHIMSLLFVSNPSVIEFSRMRLLSKYFQLMIDAYIQQLIVDKDLTALRNAGVGSLALSTLHFASASWSSYMFIASKRCCLCRKGFNGQIRSIGAFAHDECIKKNCVSTAYLCQPFSKQAIERISQNVLFALEMRASLPENAVIASLPSISWKGWSRYHGQYTYKQVFIGPHIPMLERKKTLLGWLYETDKEMYNVINYARKWSQFYTNKLRDEERQEVAKKNELDAKRQDALNERRLRLDVWLKKNNITVDIDKFKAFAPLSLFLSKTITGAPFKRIQPVLTFLPKVEELLNDFQVGTEYLLHSLPGSPEELEHLHLHVEHQQETLKRKCKEDEARADNLCQECDQRTRANACEHKMCGTCCKGCRRHKRPTLVSASAGSTCECNNRFNLPL